MRVLLSIVLAAASLAAQTAGTVTTTFVINGDFGSNRAGSVQCVLVYPDTLAPEQYPDVNAVAGEVTAFLRAFPNRSAALEAIAAASLKNLLDKYTVAVAGSVNLFLGQVLQVEAERVQPKTPAPAADAALAKIREVRARTIGAAKQ